MTGPVTLARRTMGAGALVGVAAVASSPQTVLNGGIPATYAQSGVQGVPLSFVLVMFVVALLAVGYVAVSRHVPHGAPFYAQLARGLGPGWGLAGAGVALLGYNSLQVSLFALWSTSLAGLVGAGPWWVWAAAGWLVVLLLGRYPGAANAKLLGALLACEIGIVLAFDIAAFANPADGISLDGFLPSELFIAGGGAGALVFAMAAFAGAEAVPSYGDEARSTRTIVVATFGGFGVLGVLYALTSWAYAAAVGPAGVRAGVPAADPMTILAGTWGPGIGGFGQLLLVTSVLAAMSAFSGIVARYLCALGDEGVLPAGLAAVSPGADGGAPRGGSLAQAGISAVMLAGFAVSGADPMGLMFVWLSSIGAVCIMGLLMVSSWSAVAFFGQGAGSRESVWVRQLLPGAGGVVGVLTLVFMLSNLPMLLGLPDGSPLPFLIAGPVLAVIVVVFVARGRWLKLHRPDVYAQLGRRRVDPLQVRDPRIVGLQL
ncbi:APC family permease [Paractinoplanes hotanensis]|uniref:APC family permease n=1 Tax=Paractinoplanes hotanensis TaxID=2906497 RepID=A0ABT0Y852_9ACTN|nr:APC family permease [Actinoplanes hotanensis]MCM4082227.1 APC family permease [Actinoplanes hotanensis]